MTYDDIISKIKTTFDSVYADWHTSSEDECVVFRVFGAEDDAIESIYDAVFQLAETANLALAPIVFDIADTENYYPEIYSQILMSKLKATVTFMQEIAQSQDYIRREYRPLCHNPNKAAAANSPYEHLPLAA